MKRIIVTLITVVFYSVSVAQNVGIGTSNPVASAKLELNSTTQGFLPPRLTLAQRNAIAAPAQGLMVYCVDCGFGGQPQYFNGASWVNMAGDSTKRPPQVGDFYGGGEIAYILQPGDPGYVAGEIHGYIAAHNDIASAQWGCNTTMLGSTYTGLGTGHANTDTIVSRCVSSSAARSCSDLVLNGYDDWYLPSTEELSKLYANRNLLGGFNQTNSSFYWGSSEFNSSNAEYFYFFGGYSSLGGKQHSYFIRPIRNFEIKTNLDWAALNTSIANALPVISIGTQKWSSKNLDVAYYRNGDLIPQVTDPTAWSQLTTGAWCYYNNDPALGAIYGKMYNWYAVTDPRGLAPQGWHIPGSTEWATLSTFLGGDAVAGGKMKEAGTAHWGSPNTGADNSSGFTGLPGGFRVDNGGCYSLGGATYFWSATEYDVSDAWDRPLHSGTTDLNTDHSAKKCGFYIRCIRD